MSCSNTVLCMLVVISEIKLVFFSGESGSGKSYAAQMIIRELMNITCGTAQSDLLKVCCNLLSIPYH